MAQWEWKPEKERKGNSRENNRVSTFTPSFFDICFNIIVTTTVVSRTFIRDFRSCKPFSDLNLMLFFG